MSGARYDPGENLESRLRDLGVQIEYPPTPVLAATIRAHLLVQTGTTPHRRSMPPFLRSLMALVMVVAVLLAGVLAVSPAARATVAHWLAVPGIELHVGVPSHVALGHALHLGTPVTLAEARSEVSFHILMPSVHGLTTPDAVYVAHSVAGKQVSLVYGVHPGIPRATATHVAVLITEFRARLDTLFFAKFLAGRQPRRLALGREHGYWIPAVWVPGGHLVVLYQHGNQRYGGPLFLGRARLAANTLLWQRGDVTLRLESSLTPTSATRIARSMR